MSRSMWCGCVILTLAALTAGCGPRPEDNLLKEQIAVFEQLAAAYEKVTDRKSFEAVETEIKPLKDRLTDLDSKLKALSPERKEAALKDQKAEYEQALGRLEQARKKAATAAFKK